MSDTTYLCTAWSDRGGWAKAPTPEEAVRACKKYLGPNLKRYGIQAAMVFETGPDAWVDQLGNVHNVLREEPVLDLRDTTYQRLLRAAQALPTI